MGPGAAYSTAFTAVITFGTFLYHQKYPPPDPSPNDFSSEEQNASFNTNIIDVPVGYCSKFVWLSSKDYHHHVSVECANQPKGKIILDTANFTNQFHLHRYCSKVHYKSPINNFTFASTISCSRLTNEMEGQICKTTDKISKIYCSIFYPYSTRSWANSLNIHCSRFRNRKRQKVQLALKYEEVFKTFCYTTIFTSCIALVLVLLSCTSSASSFKKHEFIPLACTGSSWARSREELEEELRIQRELRESRRRQREAETRNRTQQFVVQLIRSLANSCLEPLEETRRFNEWIETPD